jgi:hypothetical protein
LESDDNIITRSILYTPSLGKDGEKLIEKVKKTLNPIDKLSSTKIANYLNNLVMFLKRWMKVEIDANQRKKGKKLLGRTKNSDRNYSPHQS